MTEGKDTNRIHVTVVGQEGDEKTVTINSHEQCEQLLRLGLRELYGEPTPNPAKFNLVINGAVISPLTQTIHAVGIADATEVSILPKELSRGSR